MTPSRWHIFNIYHKEIKQLRSIEQAIKIKLQELNAKKFFMLKEFKEEDEGSHFRVGLFSPSSEVKDGFQSFLDGLQEKREIDSYEPLPSEERDEVDHITALAFECVNIKDDPQPFKTVPKLAYFSHNYLNQTGYTYTDEIQKEAKQFHDNDRKRY